MNTRIKILIDSYEQPEATIELPNTVGNTMFHIGEGYLHNTESGIKEYRIHDIRHYFSKKSKDSTSTTHEIIIFLVPSQKEVD